MSAVVAVRYLLAHNAPLTAVVPATRIMEGIIPQGKQLPAISVMHISTIRRHFVDVTPTELCTSRVQITAMIKTSAAGGGDVPGLESILRLIRAALPRSRGTINGVSVDSILHELDGPLLADDVGQVLMQSIDYIVRFNE